MLQLQRTDAEALAADATARGWGAEAVRAASNRWAWVPGEIVAAPIYAPALVAFVGGSGNAWAASASRSASATRMRARVAIWATALRSSGMAASSTNIWVTD